MTILQAKKMQETAKVSDVATAVSPRVSMGLLVLDHPTDAGAEALGSLYVRLQGRLIFFLQSDIVHQQLLTVCLKS